VTDTASSTLPRWSVADLHESFASRSFVDEMERVRADVARLAALFDDHDIRRCDARPVTEDDGRAADAVIHAVNESGLRAETLLAYVYATVTTDSFDETAQGLASELDVIDSQHRPLLPASPTGSARSESPSWPVSVRRPPSTAGRSRSLPPGPSTR
jgi:oligoendopeptidase F